MTPPFRVTLLEKGQDRKSFSCGMDVLDRYLQRQATQDQRRRVSACYVALEGEDRIVGFYTLAATGILLTDLPEKTRRGLPLYPLVPAALLGRLAVDHRFQGQGLGAALLADALDRVCAPSIAVHALVVQAKDGEGARFYRHHGFLPLLQRPETLFLPLATWEALRPDSEGSRNSNR